MPVERVRVGKTYKRRVVPSALARVMALVAGRGIDAALTENVNGWSRPKSGKHNTGDGQSASAAFAFGKVAGQLEQALACSGIPYAAVAPAKWKRALGLIGGDKSDSRKLACKLFPQYQHLFARVKDDGRAEAALLAHYLRATYVAHT